MKKPLLTIGMIFKNEIRCLERCLKSLESLRKMIPCEVVMADTGSTDGSREIAEKYADIVFDFPWVDDFAAARNAVIDRSSGEWYLSLDADEWLDTDSNVERLASALRHPKKDHYLICLKMRNFQKPNVTNDDYSEFYALRIAHNGMGIRYEGRIHEWLNRPKALTESGNNHVWLLNVVIYHDGYAYANKEDAYAKWNRNMELLKKTLEEDPDNLHTLSQCVDSSKNLPGDEAKEYARRSIKALHQQWDKWGYYGAKTYRDAIHVAFLKDMPELLEWAQKALELYPNSIFTRVETAYAAFARCTENGDAEAAVRWADMYQKGLADYKADNYDHSELLRGVVQFFTPSFERQLNVFLVKDYLDLSRYEDAFSTFEKIDGAKLTSQPHVEHCVYNIIELHRVSDLDTSALVTRFWDQINQTGPAEDSVEMRRAAFINVAAYSLLPDYREKEQERPHFKRRGYTALLPLEGKCILGDAAAVLEISDPAELARRISAQKLEDFPISALAHALRCGMAFPLPGQSLSLEEMEALARRMKPLGQFLELAEAAPVAAGNIRQLCWRRTLLLAGVRDCKWENEADMALAEAFAEMEREFLPVCYAPSVLTDEGVFLLPPMHRFGWYYVRAFEARKAGDELGYVRLLRKGLECCSDMKPMVEFLVKQLEENHQEQDTPELLALAQQVRMVLAQYPPDSPAVEEIRNSPAYQQVRHLIEGSEVPLVLRGVKQ